MTTKKEADIFDEDNLANPEYTFAKFEKEGDKVSGVLANDPVEVPDGNFNKNAPQMRFLLKQEDGSHVMVGIDSSKTPTLTPIKEARKGDTLGFKFTGTKDTGKGFPAKIIKAFWKQTEENKALAPAPVVEATEPVTDVPF